MPISDNILLKQLRGTFGKQVVVKQYGDKTVLTAHPNMSDRVLSAKQIEANERMREANDYAQSIITDLNLKNAALLRLNVLENKLYRVLIKEYMLKRVSLENTYADIKISNSSSLEIAPIEIKALADRKARYLSIPESIAAQLNLVEFEKREITTADGSKQLVPYMGPVKISYQDKICLTGALVVGEKVVIGSLPIEEMGIVLS